MFKDEMTPKERMEAFSKGEERTEFQLSLIWVLL